MGLSKNISRKRIKKPTTFVNELISEAQVYSRLVNPSQGEWEALTLKDLTRMGVTQPLPLLMAAKATNMKKKDFEDVVRLTEVLTMRYLIVGNQNPNELERKYSEWAIWIRSHRPLGDAYNDAKSLLSQTPDFVKGFGQMSGLPSPQVRYILRKIEEYKTSKELEVAWNGVDIEHILPQTPPDDWTAAIGQTEKKLSEISEMLGNLTIIDKRMNRSASNKSFQTKVEQYYKKSKISITSDLQHFGQWNVDTINQRQQEFAKMADDIWNLERAWR